MGVNMSEDMSTYFSGEKLYGDDFTLNQIEQWFNDEKEGYADLGAKDRQSYQYLYHQLNLHHGYSRLGMRRFKHVLGMGSAYGDEFIPIINQIDFVTIIDPSETFAITNNIDGVPCEYYKPNMDGSLSFENGVFDLITCLGVIHHVPNVSKVLRECFRCLETNGLMLIREPIVSMGDWRNARVGLTKRERGIPLKIFKEIITDSGFIIKTESLCMFPALIKLTNKVGIAAYNNSTVVWLDSLLSKLFSWNTQYHRTNSISKLGPLSVYFLLQKG